MCGVIGLSYGKDRGDLGQVAVRLLRMLEYRGYDSTGAVIQAQSGAIALRKDVGSPTTVARRLKIGELAGKTFCGQVRWATFGTVTRANAQPHEVSCRTHLYGAHNGNITNCDQLQEWLVRAGHRVLSDNDGEMLVHAVEHFFAAELLRTADRAAALKAAVLRAARRLVGSYAAVVVDPVTHRLAAIKAGSSLYMGLGRDAAHGPFHIASSDLASVLAQTTMLLPMVEDEFALYTHEEARFYHLRTGRELRKRAVRSRLKAEEMELKEPFRYFMEQEICGQPAAARKAISLFLGRGPRLKSAERPAPAGRASALELIDGLCLRDEAVDAARRSGRFVRLLIRAHRSGAAVYMIACGTSYHAAKVAAVFFNKIAGIRVCAMLPGDFRTESAASLRDGDLVIGVSQSGETKDLIDVVNLVRASGRGVAVVTVVNNMNSTLAIEKTDLCIPLCCGPEIAVPATKSFMNQLTVFYILALKAAEELRPGKETRRRRENLLRLPELLEETISGARRAVDEAARELFLAPSIHILATGMQGVAREGALKIREVVLNHAEGYEAAEFKHGPNTILGVNTVFGLDAVRSLLAAFASFAPAAARGRRLSARGLARLCRAAADCAFDDVRPLGLDAAEARVFREVFSRRDLFQSLYANYPLVFVTGPSPRDVNLTIAQIHTHRIRGADIYVIAEESGPLAQAVGKRGEAGPGPGRRSGYIRLPRTDDDLLPFFTSTLVLQLLALSMSVRKLTLMDKLGIAAHGVHPDAPKNVSKSITVA